MADHVTRFRQEAGWGGGEELGELGEVGELGKVGMLGEVGS